MASSDCIVVIRQRDQHLLDAMGGIGIRSLALTHPFCDQISNLFRIVFLEVMNTRPKIFDDELRQNILKEVKMVFRFLRNNGSGVALIHSKGNFTPCSLLYTSSIKSSLSAGWPAIGRSFGKALIAFRELLVGNGSR